MEIIMSNETQKTEIEAAVLRRLLAHLDERKDAQNIDLMNLAGFCRNCLSKWYLAEHEARDLPMDYDQAREYVYGEPYQDWKQKNQVSASKEQLEKFEEVTKK